MRTEDSDIKTEPKNFDAYKKRITDEWAEQEKLIKSKQTEESVTKTMAALKERQHLYPGRERIDTSDVITDAKEPATLAEEKAIEARLAEETAALEKVRQVGMGAIPRNVQKDS